MRFQTAFLLLVPLLLFSGVKSCDLAFFVLKVRSESIVKVGWQGKIFVAVYATQKLITIALCGCAMFISCFIRERGFYHEKGERIDDNDNHAGFIYSCFGRLW